jgi:FMN phosphatase YigB (HAD superfamily)
MATTESGPKYVVFFDIDNTLYPASASISALMTEKIRGRFGIPPYEPT